ncbi:large conductance mechanosensitive channel protein MscL [Candidatus Acetothermia bacterium]|nr:large conductance mechanosensitive channel protein MscL [Candidatus Acetothermia bacterium]
MLKEFAMRGNVLDMAIGIIIGAAFGRIVTSFVNDILMPPIGLLMGKVDFANMYMTLTEGKTPGPYPSLADAKAAGAVTISYGLFINVILDFIIVAFVIFLLIRQVNRMTAKPAPAPAAPTAKDCPYCVSAIPIKATRCPHCTSELKA